LKSVAGSEGPNQRGGVDQRELDVVSKLVSPITPALLSSNMSVVAGKTNKPAKRWAGDAESPAKCN
jgi:hypothetical protein